MISAFCIRRPRFAFVVSILITLSGLLSLPILPVAQFPDIAPPTITATATFTGASAEVVRDSVAVPIESQVNGVEDMMYMSSTSGNDGSYNLTVTFTTGTDGDIAQVNVQNRVQQAMAGLPEEVKRDGVDVRKQSNTMLLVVNLFSDNDEFDELFLANYAQIYIRDELARIPGVASVDIMGAMDFAMRIWLKPDRMASLDITTEDVVAALRAQNVQVAAGQLGAAPISETQQFQYNIIARGRLVTAEEFGNVSIRALPDGGIVRVRDVADVELGSQSYGAFGLLDNRPSAVIAVYQLPDANALSVAEAVRARVDVLAERFPEDLEAAVIYDTTRFVVASIAEVVKTLIIALLLVIMVVFLFLQDWRSTVIPAIAIPVSLIGTFAFMLALGMSINTITLFALILAIGIVVDDAIIVVENTQRLMGEGLAPPEAALESMRQVTAPVVATTLVLMAVFVPVMLMPGLTGQMYKQFAITISIAVVISSVNALTLSPALCATVLKPVEKGRAAGDRTDGMFGWFNRALHGASGFYERMVGVGIGRPLLGVASIAGLLFFLVWLFREVPTGFIPNEDQGYFMVHVQLADGASIERTGPVVTRLTNMLREEPGMEHVMAVPGYSILAGSLASNAAFMIAILDPWDERTDPSLHQMAIMERAQAKMNEVKEAQVMAYPVPPIPGVGSVGGFEFILQDRQGRPAAELAEVMYGLIGAANQRPEIAQAFTSFQASTPQMELIVNKDKAHIIGVQLTDLYETLQTFLGGLYVNDFNLFGKVFRVMAQAESEYRNDEEDLAGFYVRAKSGNLVPVTSLAEIKPIVAPQTINRYNMYNSVTINGSPNAGYSSGQAMNAMAELGNQLPAGYGYEWTGQSLQEILSGNMAPILFALAIVFVYLFLVAQYESWSIPVAVLLCVPIALTGALFANWIAGAENNLYTQIGLVLLIGMSAKSAILIVEFASEQRASGQSIRNSALTATRLRFRALLMTALSFVLGVAPLLVATGAGAASRVSLGLAIFGGMVAASVFATLLVPIYYALVQSLRERIRGERASGIKPPADPGPSEG